MVGLAPQSMAVDVIAAKINQSIILSRKRFCKRSNDDVDEMCERLNNLKQAFPEYANYRILGTVAGIEVDDKVGRYTYQKGLYVIKPSGETVNIVNDEKFKAIAW